MQRFRTDALDLFYTAIDAVRPDRLIAERLHLDGDILHLPDHRIDLSPYRRLIVLGFGKAAARMAAALETLLGERISGGLVITSYGNETSCDRVAVREAAHPVPDDAGLAATEELLALARDAGADDLVICLVSGGGSALLEAPVAGVSPGDLQETARVLLGCGAAIAEINTIRKHLSRVKGGRLAEAIAPAAGLSLILSDVIGDPVDAIASGPTAPDPTTFADCAAIVERYGIGERLPEAVRAHLAAGARGDIPDTPADEAGVAGRVTNVILGGNTLALSAMKAEAEARGYGVKILTDRLSGEARDQGERLATALLEDRSRRPTCWLFGGETTVTVRGHGTGGRNQEFVLAALLALEWSGIRWVVLSGGTDGVDGPTDAAGAIATPETWDVARRSGLDPRRYLERNDSHSFFEAVDGLVRTGPTGTNVMDVGVLMRE